MSYEFPRSTPESMGISSLLVKEIIEDIEKFDYVKGIVMVRHGHVIAEGYWKPFEKNTQHALWSLSKSFTSCAVGLAQNEGLLKLDDNLVAFFPEYRDSVTDEKMFRVTLRDLLTMRSGHDQCAFAYAQADPDKDWIRGFLSSPLQFEPGTHFAYNSLGTHMLAAVLKKVSSCNVREYLGPRLFAPLEITPGIWDSSPAGINAGGFGFHLTTRDVATFAQLLLNKGKWQGREILPADYLEEAVRPHADNSMNVLPDWRCGYGYQFWRSRHGFRGDGACGQYAVVLPEQDMVIAVNSAMAEMGRVLDVFWEKLIPGIKELPLKESAAEFAALEQKCRNLEISPSNNKLIVKRRNCAFSFAPNAAGIESGKLEFCENECVLELKTSHGTEVIKAGFGHFAKSVIQIQDQRPHEVAGCALWKDEDTLEIKLIFIDSTFRDTWEIGYKNGTADIKWRSICSLFRPTVPSLTVCGFSEY